MERRLKAAAGRGPAAGLGLLLLAIPASAQLSPGELSRVHADLEGSRGCLRCHESGRGVSPERCLDCHELLGERIAAGRGLHARPGLGDCQRCHIEHHGRDFDLIWWGESGRQGFRHEDTGLTLDGRHAELGCRDCHRAERMPDTAGIRDRGKDPARTYLGLDPACLSCHTEPHGGSYGSERCLSCHSTRAWKPATGFDHGRTAYPLLGRHREVDCARCHPSSEETAAASGAGARTFRGLSFARCADCHRNPHAEDLGARACEECHRVEGFRPAVFDHERSAFPLRGSHRKVACARCHRSGPGSETGGVDTMDALRLRGLPHGDCSDCHRDPHEARLGATCGGCHDPSGWRTVTSPRFDHARARYPLAGRHREVPCRSCHPADAPLAVVGYERCSTCHRDPHGGQLSEGADSGACESCHRVEGFRPSTYGLARHREARFAVDGAHEKLSCRACHLPGSTGASEEAVESAPVEMLRFRFPSRGCTDCHRDPHEGHLDRFLGEEGCRACHETGAWAIVAFDHDLSGTPLAGAHRKVACRACHGERDGSGAPVPEGGLRWKPLGSRCADCHADPHGGQFLGDGAVTACGRCHGPEAWRELVFDHDRDAAFALKGKHRETPCADCHPREEAAGRSLVRYRPRSTACRDCHGRGRSGAPGGKR